MTRWSAITRTRRSYSALAYGSRSTAAAETTSTGSYTTSWDATAHHFLLTQTTRPRGSRGSSLVPAFSKLGYEGRALEDYYETCGTTTWRSDGKYVVQLKPFDRMLCTRTSLDFRCYS